MSWEAAKQSERRFHKPQFVGSEETRELRWRAEAAALEEVTKSYCNGF